jgi:prepilin-type processing-associated H-X9-DG protein
MSAEANQLTNVLFLDGYRVELIERRPQRFASRKDALACDGPLRG